VARQSPAKVFLVERITRNDSEPLMRPTDLFGRPHQRGNLMSMRQRLFDEFRSNSPRGSYNE